VEADAEINDVGIAFRVLRSTDQLLVYDGQCSDQEIGLKVAPGHRYHLSFAFDVNLTRGQYYFDLLIGHTPTQNQLARLTPAGHMTVVEKQTWGGVANLMVRTTVRTVEANIDSPSLEPSLS
jgi:hypothetical protein